MQLKHTTFLFSSLLLCRAISSNLLCNGDFESYVLTDSYLGDYYVELPSNLTCWYNLNHNEIIEVKNISSPITTKGVELTSDRQYTLCQKVMLNPSSNYTLGYSLYCPQRLWDMQLSIKVNGNQVSTLFIANPQSFNSGSITFQPDQTENQICFSENHQVNWFYSLKNYVGGIVDNITLIEIIQPNSNPVITTNQTQSNNTNSIIDAVTNQTSSNMSNTTSSNHNTTSMNDSTTQMNDNTTSSNDNTIENNSSSSNQHHINNSNAQVQNDHEILQQKGQFNQELSGLHIPQKEVVYINFVTIPKEIDWEIQLVGDRIYEDWIAQPLNKALRVYIEGEEQKQFQITKNQDNMVIVYIKIYRSYDLSTLEAVVENKQQFEMWLEFIVTVDGKPIYFNILGEEEKEVIEAVSPIAETMPSVVFKIYEIISSSLSSFFILSLFNFWNLSLMYNFLLLKTVPNFSRNIYEVMLNLLYQRGSFSEWITKNFEIPEQVFEISQQEQSEEKMAEYINGFAWFRKFGFSSNPLVNNFDFLLMYGLLILKVALLMIVLRFLPEKIKRSLGIEERFFKIFIIQTIAFAPFIMVSAFTSITNASSNFSQKMQVLIQVTLLFICIFLLPLLIYESHSWLKPLKNVVKNYEKINEKKRIPIKKKKLKQGLRTRQNQTAIEILELVLAFSIPMTIWLNNPRGFLVFNLLILILRSIGLFKFMKDFSVFDKIYIGLMNFVWIVHHLIFIAFWILEEIEFQKNGDSDTVSKVIAILGICSFMTVLIGGGIELLKFFIQFSILIIRVIRALLCNASKKATDQDQIKQGDKSERKLEMIVPVKGSNLQEQVNGLQMRQGQQKMVQIINQRKIFGKRRKYQPSQNL